MKPKTPFQRKNRRETIEHATGPMESVKHDLRDRLHDAGIMTVNVVRGTLRIDVYRQEDADKHYTEIETIRIRMSGDTAHCERLVLDGDGPDTIHPTYPEETDAIRYSTDPDEIGLALRIAGRVTLPGDRTDIDDARGLTDMEGKFAHAALALAREQDRDE